MGETAGGGGLGAVAEELAVGGVQEGRLGSGEGCDVDCMLFTLGVIS